jgi:hypothetical protein
MNIVKQLALSVAVSLMLVGTASAQIFDDFVTIPEPGSLSLLLTGIGVGAASLWRRRK